MVQQKADDPKQRAPLVRGLLYPLPLMLQAFPALTGKRRVQLVAEAIGSLVYILSSNVAWAVVVVAHRTISDPKLQTSIYRSSLRPP